MMVTNAALGADLPAVKRALDSQLSASGLALPTIELYISQPGSAWPGEAQSFAFEKTDVNGSSAVHVQSEWADASSEDEAAFVLAHEMAHALCGHTFKLYGLYAQQTQATGLTLSLMAEGANSDHAFQFGQKHALASMELEADLVAAALASSAGFDAHAGAQAAIGSSEASLDHASGPDRIEAIGVHLAAHSPSVFASVLACQRREPDSY